jgi:hypothetical protein
MQACMQTSGISVYKHGEIERALDNNALQELDAATWRLPSWVTEHKDILRDAVASEYGVTTYDYLLYHDIGKPYCRVVDADGKQHFPGHAEASEAALRVVAANHDYGGQFQQRYCCEVDHIAAAVYAGMDMDAHLLKQDGVAEFASRPQAPILLLAALSEIHANAGMFGGLESTSFKIKWKQLSKMGARVLEHIVANKSTK